MKKINLKKYFSIFAVIAVLSPVLLSFQNFRHYETPLEIEKDETPMTEDFTAALKTAEDEQMYAMNQELENKKHFKKVRKPASIGEYHFLDSRQELNDEMSVDETRSQVSSQLTEE